MPPKTGPIIRGHPYLKIQISADGKIGEVYQTLIDTGFSGFVSLPVVAVTLLGLKARATARYTMANGKLTDPVPLAEGYASIEGESYAEGLISISENTSAVVGMNFMRRTGKALILLSIGVVSDG